MAETPKALVWPTGTWKFLKRLVRAWYTTAESGKEVTQKSIAAVAGIYPSRLSANKPFLQAIGILDAEGNLTEDGKLLGLGITNENDLVTKQALQGIVKANPILRQLSDVIRGRGTTDRDAFEAQIVTITKQGKQADYFGTGVAVLQDILLESGLVAFADEKFKASKDEIKDEPASPSQQAAEPGRDAVIETGLRKLPIAVSASKVWYIQIDENPDIGDIERFIEVQKMVFGLRKLESK